MTAGHSPILVALAAKYRKSKAGREGSSRDYVADFRTLLQLAHSADGEARLQADEDLRRAVHASKGKLTLDLHARDKNIIHRVRLHSGGEAWLFTCLGEIAPAVQRQSLSGLFAEHATQQDIHPGWRAWLDCLSKNAQQGGNIQPFEREDLAGNRELLRVIERVLTWRGESLIRYASAVICGDSKRLEALCFRVQRALQAIVGDESATLSSFGILSTPRTVLVHGALVLELPGGRLDLGLLTGPVALSGTDLQVATAVASSVAVCLTVENEAVFCELAKRNPDVLLVHTSFPGAATCRLLSRLPVGMKFFHFGDSDPAGFDILRDLRERTKRCFQSVGMQFRPSSGAPALTEPEQKTIARLLRSAFATDEVTALEAMQAANSKGDFEQESLGQSGLDAVLERVLNSAIPDQVAHKGV